MFTFELIFLCLTLCHVIRVMFSFLLYIRSEGVLKSVFGFFSLLCCQALALSLIQQSGPALLSFGPHGNYLLENNENYTAFFSSAGSHFVNNVRNSTSSFFHSGLIAAVFEHPCVTHILLLLTLKNGFSLFSKVKQLFRNLTQEFALRQSGGRRQGVCKNIGRYLPQLSPLIVLNFTRTGRWKQAAGF